MHSAFVTAVKTAGPAINPLLPTVPDLVWGGIIFVAILFFFIRFVVPRLTTVLDARRDAIEGGLKRAEEAQAEAANARDEYAARLAEARSEAARIREQARQDGDRIIQEKKAQAQVEADRVHEQARVQLEVERSAARTALRNEVGTLAVDLASRVVGETLSDDARATALVERFLEDLEESSAPSSGASK